MASSWTALLPRWGGGTRGASAVNDEPPEGAAAVEDADAEYEDEDSGSVPRRQRSSTQLPPRVRVSACVPESSA